MNIEDEAKKTIEKYANLKCINPYININVIDLRKKETQRAPEIIKLIKLSGIESQQELAKKLGVRPASISDYKTGKTAITVNTLKSWCEILGINIKKLF